MEGLASSYSDVMVSVPVFPFLCFCLQYSRGPLKNRGSIFIPLTSYSCAAPNPTFSGQELEGYAILVPPWTWLLCFSIRGFQTFSCTESLVRLSSLTLPLTLSDIVGLGRGTTICISNYGHTSEILEVHFQTTAIKQIK